MKVTMPVWKLVDIYQGKHPGGHFFDRDTLKFFGERLSDMRVLSETETIKDCSGEARVLCFKQIAEKTPGRSKKNIRIFRCGDTRPYCGIRRNEHGKSRDDNKRCGSRVGQRNECLSAGDDRNPNAGKAG